MVCSDAAQRGTATLVGRVVGASGKAVPQAQVRLKFGGSVAEDLTDDSGVFSREVSGRFELEVSHPQFRTVRSSAYSLPGGELYEMQIELTPGDPRDIDRVELQLEEVASGRNEPEAREGLPKADRLFGLRGGVNVSGIAEGSGQQWIAASGNVFTSSSMATAVGESSDFSAELGDYRVTDDALPAGDDMVHGNMYFFHRNDRFNARNFFDPPDQPIPPFKYHFFGGELGGPLGRQTYFYSHYWGLRIHQSITRAATVPEPAWLRGDFSSLSSAILDPETGLPFPDNRIPSSRLHSQGLALVRLYPDPNVPGATIQNYRGVAKLNTSADTFGLRVDHRLTVSDETFFEYQYNRDTTEDPFNLLSGITNLPFFGARDALDTHTIRVHNTHIFSPLWIHQFRMTYTLLEQPRTILNGEELPAILITGLSNLGHGNNLPQERRNRSFEVLNGLSWTGGQSVTKIGVDLRYFTFRAFMDLYRRGQYQFTSGLFAGHPFANLLLGVPTNALRIQGDTRRDFRTWTASVYSQRDWRPTPRLTLNLGVRYDFQKPFREDAGRIANFDPRSGAVESSRGRFYDSDRNNFGPRLGLSWQPVEETVLKAGYGVFYDTLAVGDSLFLLGLNSPFVRFDLENNGPVLPRFDLTTAFEQRSESVAPSVFSASRDLPNPYLQQWNFSIERSLGRTVTFELAYVGQKGTRLRRQLNVNQPAPGPLGSLDERRPFQGFRNIFRFETSASSIAHALEVRSTRRFRSGLGFSATYLFARAIDDATLISILPQNSHDLRSERGLADFHFKHRLLFSWVYNLPLLRGWQIQGVGTLQSGTPLSAILGTDVAGTGNPIVNRPDLIHSPRLDNPGPSRFFDPGAFRLPESGSFGNSGRNVIIGPGIANLDLALTRTFRLSDAVRTHLRADFYNVLNHPNFVAPPSMQNFADSPDFGALFVARSPRIVQIGLKFLW